MSDRYVYFAKLTRPQAGAFDSFAEDVLGAIDPSEHVTRYGREWRVSRPRLADGVILGKLGFVRRSPSAETRYDEQLEDFVTIEGEASQGSFSMFAIDVDTEVLAFEERLPAIRRQSFVGALRGLLHAKDQRWTVTLLPDATGFREFVASVDRLERVRTVIHRPNPGFVDAARNLEALIEESRAERAEVVAVAPPNETLNADAEWIQGALEQVSSDGKGTVKATGTRHGQRRHWVIGARLQVAIITERDGEEPEDVWTWMKRRLRESFRGR